MPSDSGVLERISTLVFGGTRDREASAANRGWLLVLSGTAVFGLVLIGVLAPSLRAFAGGAVVAVGAGTTGALAGFLFGLPRAPGTGTVVENEAGAPPNAPGGSVEARQGSGYRANTNLEDISDWLTKILVGVGLTQIEAIPGQFQRLVEFARPAIGSGQDTASIAAGILIAYSIIGFMSAYLWARTRAGAAFRLGDRAGLQRLHQLEARLSEVQASTRGAAINQLDEMTDRFGVRIQEAEAGPADLRTRHAAWFDENRQRLEQFQRITTRLRREPDAVPDAEIHAAAGLARELIDSYRTEVEP